MPGPSEAGPATEGPIFVSKRCEATLPRIGYDSAVSPVRLVVSGKATPATRRLGFHLGPTRDRSASLVQIGRINLNRTRYKVLWLKRSASTSARPTPSSPSWRARSPSSSPTPKAPARRLRSSRLRKPANVSSDSLRSVKRSPIPIARSARSSATWAKRTITSRSTAKITRRKRSRR